MHKLTPRSVKSQSRYLFQDRAASEGIANSFMKVTLGLAGIILLASVLMGCADYSGEPTLPSPAPSSNCNTECQLKRDFNEVF